MRFMQEVQMDKPATINPPAKHYTINQLISRMYTSRFNRDMEVPLFKDEEFDNSKKSRIYNKKDMLDLIKLFFDFFEWVIVEDNVDYVRLSKNLYLRREPKMPKLKKANIVDKIMLGDEVEVGKYYATKGRYSWKMWTENEVFKSMQRLWEGDPERQRNLQELEVEVEKWNAKRNG